MCLGHYCSLLEYETAQWVIRSSPSLVPRLLCGNLGMRLKLTMILSAVLLLSFGVLLPDLRLWATSGKSSRDKRLGQREEEGERKERVGKRRGRRGGKELNSQGDALSLPPTPVRQQLLWNTTRLANSALYHVYKHRVRSPYSLSSTGGECLPQMVAQTPRSVLQPSAQSVCPRNTVPPHLGHQFDRQCSHVLQGFFGSDHDLVLPPSRLHSPHQMLIWNADFW